MCRSNKPFTLETLHNLEPLKGFEEEHFQGCISTWWTQLVIRRKRWQHIWQVLKTELGQWMESQESMWEMSWKQDGLDGYGQLERGKRGQRSCWGDWLALFIDLERARVCFSWEMTRLVLYRSGGRWQEHQQAAGNVESKRYLLKCTPESIKTTNVIK